MTELTETEKLSQLRWHRIHFECFKEKFRILKREMDESGIYFGGDLDPPMHEIEHCIGILETMIPEN